MILTGEPEYRTRESLEEVAEKVQQNLPIEFTHINIQKNSAGEHYFPDLTEHLKHTDLVMLSIRFAKLIDSDYQALDRYLSHRSFIAIRTTNHMLNYSKDSKNAAANKDFPTRHFGCPYRGHPGHSSSQLNYVMSSKHPLVKGIEPRFWTPDFLYAVNPLAIECTPIIVGQALKGREKATFKTINPGNHMHILSDQDNRRLTGTPHPVLYTIDNQPGRRALYTSIGARGSFANPNVQKLYQNAILWCLEFDQ